jgi:alkylhydroperoxidase family enzyme
MNSKTAARIAPLEENDPRSQDPVLEELVNFVGYRPNALLTMARKPGVVPALLQLLGVTLRGDGLFPESLRFLIAAETSRGARCRYTTTHLVHAAHHLGVGWDKLAALPYYQDDSRYSEHERTALTIATAGSNLPVREPAEAIAQARVVFTDEQIAEIVSCVAMVGWFNRWNGLMGSELEAVPSEALVYVPWLRELET